MDSAASLPKLQDALFVLPLGDQLGLIVTLGVALLLSSLIGLERELRMKSAGLRTHALVGIASCLIMLVSKYGFGDVLRAYEIALDPSRIAAQIVSGIGFIGGGLIFVQRDVVRGLTTAATIWLVAGVGMACGAGLPVLAVFVTGAYFLVVFAYTPVAHRMFADHLELHLELHPGRGTVQQVLDQCTGRGFVIEEVGLEVADGKPAATRQLKLRMRGRAGLLELLLVLGDMEGVETVRHVRL